MRFYSVTSPAYPRAELRLVCYQPASMMGRWKMVLQAIEHGKPLATHPLAEDMVETWQAVQDWIAWHQSEGWIFDPVGHVVPEYHKYHPRSERNGATTSADLRSAPLGALTR